MMTKILLILLGVFIGMFATALMASAKSADRRMEELWAEPHCKDCVWYAPIDSNPTAKKIHEILDIGNETGVCRKLTYTEDRPVLTRPDGYCHRAERRET